MFNGRLDLQINAHGAYYLSLCPSFEHELRVLRLIEKVMYERQQDKPFSEKDRSTIRKNRKRIVDLERMISFLEGHNDGEKEGS